MTVRRPSTVVAAIAICTAIGAGCSSDEPVSDDTLPSVATTVAIATSTITPTITPTSPGPTSPTVTSPTVTTSSPGTAPTNASSTTSTSSTPATSSTTSTSTTSTVPLVGEALVLRDDGVGDALFGAHPDDVIPYVSGILGDPTTDSGWSDPMSFGVCPGSEVRLVTWDDLALLFTDSSVVTSGRRHFFTYTFGPPFVQGRIEPNGPRTELGIGVGSTVAELKAAYPNAVVNAADDIFDANFAITETLTGFLSGDGDTDTIRSFTGGISCGE